MLGRPTKYNEARVGTICALLRLGCSRKTAAAGAGIDFQTFLNWRRRYSTSSTALTRAEAEASIAMTLCVTRAAAAGNVEAALFWLSRRRPEEWGP